LQCCCIITIVPIFFIETLGESALHIKQNILNICNSTSEKKMNYLYACITFSLFPIYCIHHDVQDVDYEYNTSGHFRKHPHLKFEV
jgi:hypothetical protein